MYNDDLKYWLALSFIKDVGPVTIKRLLSVFHSPKRILEADINELRQVEDISEAKAKNIYEFNSWGAVEDEIEKIKKHNIRVITYIDREYPESLRQINDSPVALYVKGCIEMEDRYAIAIVGTRTMSEYGRRAAETISSRIASLGITIVSGMARGIDTIAHQSALKSGGRSIAVLGCGLDRPYPGENKRLFDSLCSAGCVISEFPIGTPPNKENFPQRNRLISGLSLGVVVIEAADVSGSLITANYAVEQNKEVFAVPGSIFSKESAGTNALIKKGAKLVQKTEDILEELSPALKNMIMVSGLKSDNAERISSTALAISDEEKAICNILRGEPKHIDAIVRETGVNAARLLSLLLGLEIKGIVRQIDGKRFCIG
ncbi:MAG: DNA-processing protein DprA [Nitrospirae bacterium]|nr:DNA-processing protein DprA [Nitrospirota bacterium]